jgi:hypothetical protein
MKKVIAVITLLIAFSSSAFALQLGNHDEGTGLKIVEWSPQLLLEH